MVGDDAPSRSRGLRLLPPFCHGRVARGRNTEACRGAFRPLDARDWHLPMVSFRGSPVRRRRGLAQGLGVKHLRTGLSWADSFRPHALAWFDRQMEALADFDVTVTFCFTPEHRGIAPHHTSPPQVAAEYAEFCAAMVRRYAPFVPVPKADRPVMTAN